MYKKLLPLQLLTLLPIVTNAATYTFKSFIDMLVGIINTVIPILITLAIVLFFYHSGIGIFGASRDGANNRTKLKETLLWGVGIIFVMVSVWGIINLIGGELDLIKTR